MITAAALAIALTGPTKAAVTVSLVTKVEGLHPLAFAPSPTGSKVAMTLENKDVRIVDAATRQTIRTLTGHHEPPYAVAWSKDGAFIATGDESARIFIWNALTGERMKTIIGHIRGIQCLSFNRTHTLLASTGKDDVLNVWSIPAGKKVAEIDGKGANLYSGCFDPKVDNLLLVGMLSGGAKTYAITSDGAKAKSVMDFTEPYGAEHNVLDCNWSDDGTKAVTAAKDDLAVLWNMKTGKKLGSFRGHTDWVVHSVFSPNGNLIATSSSDRTVKVWETSNFEPVTTIENEGAVGAPLCFTSDGKFLLTTGVDDGLEVYSVTPSQGGSAAIEKTDKHGRRSRRHHG